MTMTRDEVLTAEEVEGKDKKRKEEFENRKLERRAKEWFIKDKGGSIIQSLVNLIKEFTDPREKQIEIDAEQIRALQKQNGELTDKVKELEAQIEKMKCCANCVFSESDRLNGTFCHKEGCFVLASAKCKLWEY